MDIGNLIKEKRCEYDMTQYDLAALLGVEEMTVSSFEEGNLELLTTEIRNKLAFMLNIPITAFISKDESIPEDLIDTEESDSRSIFVANLRRLMELHGKSRKEVSDDLHVSYFTFVDWHKGKSYPRIEKLQAIAQYFGVTVAELVGEPTDVNTSQPDAELFAIFKRLKSDAEFLDMVYKLADLDVQKISALKQLIDIFYKE